MRTIRSEISNLQRDVDSAQKAYDAVAARLNQTCLLYTSDAADDLLCVDLGGRRIIKKKIQQSKITHITT